MNDTLLFALGLGFLLGLKHATEADHLVAVTTIVSEQRSLRRSAMVGALWGVGHTASLLVVGLFVIFLEVAIPEQLSHWIELAVALMIVLLGVRILYLLTRRQERVHVHTHAHDGGALHTHLHFHDDADAHSINVPHTHNASGHQNLAGWKPVVVGMVHGLAGSAALTLLVLTEVVRGGSRLLGLSYLLLFGAGSIGGMLLMSALISLPFILARAHFRHLRLPLHLMAGLGSVTFGIYYAWGAVQSL